MSASCSLHLPRESLTKILQSSAARAGRQAMIVHQGGLGADHPVNVAMPEMDYLKAKVDSGADYICTQLFFDNHDFFDFRDRCELAGINVPIIAGIMPVTSISGMQRMADLAAGSRFPAKLLKSIDRCNSDSDAVERVGIQYATEQCSDLLNNGVDGIHF